MTNKSPSSKAVEAVIQGEVKYFLKSQEFKKSDRSFHRQKDEMLQVVNFQTTRLNTPDEAQFTINLNVVFLDVKMPDLDGIKTLEILKKKYPLVEVVMLTGHAAIHSAIEALKFGAFDYLTKPCDLNDLISKAKQAASRKKEREAIILSARMKPYISDRERDELISNILDT